MIDTQSQAVTVEQLVERARGFLEAPTRCILGIAGTPGAGKSTVTEALVEALGPQVAVVGMDAYHLANRELIRLGRRERKGAPDTFDVGGYRAMLRRLRSDAGEGILAPLFDRSIEEAIAGAVPVGPEVRLVITEGNYLLYGSLGWQTIRAELDEVWFIRVDAAERRRRLVARRLGHGHPQAEAEAWVDDVDEPNARLVDATQKLADLVVDVVTTPITAERAQP